MVEQQAVAPPNPNNPNNPNNGGEQGNMLQSMLKNLAFFFMIKFLMHNSGLVPVPEKTSQQPQPPQPPQQPQQQQAHQRAQPPGPRRQLPADCLWPPLSRMSLHVYVTDTSTPTHTLPNCRLPSNNHHNHNHHNPILAQWHETDLILHDQGTTSTPFYNNDRHVNLTLPLSRTVRWNETHLYAHVCLVREDEDDKEKVEEKNKNKNNQPLRRNVLLKSVPLTRHRKRRRVRDEKNLLETKHPSIHDDKDHGGVGGADETIAKSSSSLLLEETERSPLTIAGANRTHDQTLLYLKPSLTFQLVNVHSMPKFPSRNKIPPQMEKHMDWFEVEDDDDDDPSSSSSVRLTNGAASSSIVGDRDWFYPLLYSSEFWITTTSLMEVNDTMAPLYYASSNTDSATKTNTRTTADTRIDYGTDTNATTVTIEMHLQDVSMWKWQLMAQMEESWRLQEDLEGESGVGGAGGGSGMDVLRTMLLETNPVLLVITAIVSLLHTVFDILAFKNDIKFFKGKTSMEGLSLRSMLVNAMSQLVILLYLVDNETSFMVLMSNGVGVLIELWKITRAVDVAVVVREPHPTEEDGGSSTNGGGAVGRRFWNKYELQWEEKEGYKGSKTKEYDETATSHLLFITTPLVVGYGVYSLVYQKHRGWYSWILNTLVGFIYMFGFVMMTPQLFINYKLQSVAHLNWRTLTYKSINTFIDDLFAFVIKMPIMHRLACLRDDVIFFIFLYQRYKYRTDFTRVNEFGQCEEPTEELLKELKSENEEGSGKKEGEDRPRIGAVTGEVEKKAGVGEEVGVGKIRRRGARDKWTRS